MEKENQENKVHQDNQGNQDEHVKQTKAIKKATKKQEKRIKMQEKKDLKEANKCKAAEERQQKKDAAAIKKAENALKEKPIRFVKPVKYIILAVLSAVIIVLGYMAYSEYTQVETIETEETRYSYTLTQEPSYNVKLAPNELYPTEVVDEGGIYLAYLIDTINSNFTTTFQGSESSLLTGAYRIDAELVTYTTEDEIKKDIWCKTYPLVPIENFRHEGDSYTLEESLSVDYTTYTDFIVALEEATEIMLPTELRIRLTGNMRITTPYKTFNQPLTMTLIAPVGEKYIEIEKVTPEKVEEVVQEKVSTTVPKDNTGSIIYCVLIMLVMIALILCYRYIGELTDEEKYNKKLGALLTEHGARMISVASVDTAGYTTCYNLQTIDDLIKVADELEKPVMYCKGNEALSTHAFYVMEQETLYQFFLQFQPEDTSVACNNTQEETPIAEDM